jgi:iron complex outermembrane receptor protein
MRQFKAAAVGAALSIFCTFILLTAAYARADEPAPRPFDISPQSLASALSEFARQSQQEILFAPDVVAQKLSSGVRGTMHPLAALKMLLQGSGLTITTTPNGAILVGAPGSAATSSGGERAAPLATGEDSSAQQENARGSFWDRFRLAQVDRGTTGDSSSAEKQSDQNPQNDTGREKLEEIIVTAQKRVERLQDVPVPVTAISADSLVERNQLRIQDYFTSVPGLSATPGDFHGSPYLSIRGLTTGGGFLNPTVGVVVDDVPYGSSTGLGGGFQAPDIDPSDLAQVEVLRGPQGTLYGASTIGGLLKFVSVDPSTKGVTGRIQGGISSVYNGDGIGYNVRGAANIPLSDTSAVRASGFTRRDAGYIDDPVLGLRGVNRTDAEGGRLAALWQPSENVSLKLSALLQHTDVDGAPTVDLQPGLGDLQHSDLPGTGPYGTRFQAYSATLTAKVGRAALTSLSGYTINSYSDTVDFTPALGAVTQGRFGVPGTPLHDSNETKKFTQEIRLTAPVGQRVELMLGAFYTDEDSLLVQDILVGDATGAVINLWSHSAPVTAYEEYAAFANLTFNITDRFDVQIGGRESQNRQTYKNTIVGPYGPVFLRLPSNPYVYPDVTTKENSFTYLLTPRLKVSPDLMVYARLASGYRPGGPNPNAVTVGLPTFFKPDQTQNYEIGIKGQVLERVLSFDASLYYIDWKDVQLNLTDPVSRVGYRFNAGSAKSQGVELSVESRPLTGLTIAGWAAWNHAVLGEDLPPTSTSARGLSGDRLPYSARWSGNLSVDQEFPLTSSVIGFAGGSFSYVGDRKGVFRSVALRQTFPAYTQVDLRAGVRHDSWTVNAFITNVADKRGVLTGGLGTSPNPLAFNYIQPRTAGLALSKTF